MYCIKCGTQNAETAANCIQCGEVLRSATPVVAQPVRIPNYLVQAILCTLFCCLPLGIVAIVYAAQVNSKVAGGDIAGAQAASEKAKTFAWLSFGIGLAGTLIYLVLVMIGSIQGW